MPNPPWITIAIPSYNRAPLLERAVRSVLAQSDCGWELWIVDDQSTDGAWELGQAATRWSARIHAERNADNLGLSGNFRRAATQGRAPYVLLLAADDYLEPTFLEKVHAVVATDPELALVSGRRVQHRPGKRGNRYYATPLCGRFEAGQTIARALAHGNLYGLYSSVVVRRDALESIGGVPADNPWAGDFEAWVNIAARYPIYFAPSALAFQHLGQDTQTARFLATGRLVAYEWKTLRRLLSDESVTVHLSPKDQQAAERRIVALWWSVNLYRLLRGGPCPPLSSQRPAVHAAFVPTVLTLMKLWYNRLRLTY